MFAAAGFCAGAPGEVDVGRFEGDGDLVDEMGVFSPLAAGLAGGIDGERGGLPGEMVRGERIVGTGVDRVSRHESFGEFSNGREFWKDGAARLSVYLVCGVQALREKRRRRWRQRRF